MTGLLTTYLGAGILADRPVTPDIAPKTLALYKDETGAIWYWETESDEWLAFKVDEAPVDGSQYVRKDGAWVVFAAEESGIPDAPVDGFYYLRMNGTWALLPAYPDVPVEEAPLDSKQYVRKDGVWVEVVIPDAPGEGLEDAPEDGKLYGRKDGTWTEVVIPGGGGEAASGRVIISVVDLVGVNTAKVDFDGTLYTEVEVVFTGNFQGSNPDSMQLRVNELSSLIYSYERRFSNRTNVGANTTATDSLNGQNALIPVSGHTGNANASFVVFRFLNPDVANMTKIGSFNGRQAIAAAGVEGYFMDGNFEVKLQAALTSIRLSSAGAAFIAGSRLTVYGSKKPV